MTDEGISRKDRNTSTTYLVTNGIKTQEITDDLPRAVELTYRLNQENPDRPVFVMEGGLIFIPIPVDNNQAWFIRYGEDGNECVAVVRGSDRRALAELSLRLARCLAPDVPEDELVAEFELYDPEKHQAEYLAKHYKLDH